MDPCVLTKLGRSTSGFHRPGRPYFRDGAQLLLLVDTPPTVRRSLRVCDSFRNIVAYMIPLLFFLLLACLLGLYALALVVSRVACFVERSLGTFVGALQASLGASSKRRGTVCLFVFVFDVLCFVFCVLRYVFCVMCFVFWGLCFGVCVFVSRHAAPGARFAASLSLLGGCGWTGAPLLLHVACMKNTKIKNC